MSTEKRSTRLGAALILFAILLRLMTGDTELKKISNFGWREFFSETGKIIRLPQISVPTAPATEPTVPAPTESAAPVFTSGDMENVRVMYASDFSYRPDLEALLQRPLQWELRADEPTVLILHTHGSESFTKTADQNYRETSAYRTLDCEYNVVALGDLLQEMLEKAGITVLHDRTMHDHPSYNDSYENARNAAQEYLRQYPSIRMVLDVHRDAALKSDGTQYATSASVNGVSAAQLMLVVGSDASGRYHTQWQENLAVALKLHAELERICPGITRPLILRAQRFNHDLAQGAMIVEVGTAGNTLAQAKAAIPVLAQAIIELAGGANTGG